MNRLATYEWRASLETLSVIMKQQFNVCAKKTCKNEYH